MRLKKFKEFSYIKESVETAEIGDEITISFGGQKQATFIKQKNNKWLLKSGLMEEFTAKKIIKNFNPNHDVDKKAKIGVTWKGYGLSPYFSEQNQGGFSPDSQDIVVSDHFVKSLQNKWNEKLQERTLNEGIKSILSGIMMALSTLGNPALANDKSDKLKTEMEYDVQDQFMIKKNILLHELSKSDNPKIHEIKNMLSDDIDDINVEKVIGSIKELIPGDSDDIRELVNKVERSNTLEEYKECLELAIEMKEIKGEYDNKLKYYLIAALIAILIFLISVGYIAYDFSKW